MEKVELEEGSRFLPQFGDNGLIPCIATSAHSGKVLMFAYMNELSLKLSLETGEAHYWSRSRAQLWHKGATSGQVQKIKTMRIDCDQDCVLIEVEMPLIEGGHSDDAHKGLHEVSCHTGREGCFYRDVELVDGEIKLKPSR